MVSSVATEFCENQLNTHQWPSLSSDLKRFCSIRLLLNTDQTYRQRLRSYDRMVLFKFDYYIFSPPAQSRGCNDFLFGVHCVEEGDRIPPPQSYGQALKQKECFSGVLADDCGVSANLLD